MPDPDLIPLREFYRRFAVSKSAFWRMAARGEAPDVVRLGRKNFVPLAGARAWLAARIVPAQSICRPRAGGAA
jgi:predicted DNA-binding transcriptional regulator AlpA